MGGGGDGWSVGGLGDGWCEGLWKGAVEGRVSGCRGVRKTRGRRGGGRGRRPGLVGWLAG